MENASKALEIAAGVLLAVLIMSLIAYFFTSISEWPEQQDDEKEAEQTAKFNLEYEVYDKKGMYGTDVISCLTKAESNNEKYYDGGSFLSGQKYGETYWINVYVNLKKDLEEEMIVYYLEPTASNPGIYNQVTKFGVVTNPKKTPQTYTLEEVGLVFNTSPNKKKYTAFEESDILEGGKVNKLSVTNGDLPTDLKNNIIDTTNYVISDNSTGTSIEYDAWLYEKNGDTVDTDSITPLQILLDTCSTNIKQIIMNPKKDEDSLKAWSTVEWRTAMYDFKTRKFRCDTIKYSEVTGRVNEIYFSEI